MALDLKLVVGAPISVLVFTLVGIRLLRSWVGRGGIGGFARPSIGTPSLMALSSIEKGFDHDGK